MSATFTQAMRSDDNILQLALPGSASALPSVPTQTAAKDIPSFDICCNIHARAADARSVSTLSCSVFFSGRLVLILASSFSASTSSSLLASTALPTKLLRERVEGSFFGCTALLKMLTAAAACIAVTNGLLTDWLVSGRKKDV
jgi:hypothetical protein